MILSSHQMQLSLDLLTKRFTQWFGKLWTDFFPFVCLLLRTVQCHHEWCNAPLLPSALCHECCSFLLYFLSEEMINAVALPTANYSNIIHMYFSPATFLCQPFFHGCPLSNNIFYGFTHVQNTTNPVVSVKRDFFSVCVSVGDARFFSHTLSFIGLDDIVAGMFRLY